MVYLVRHGEAHSELYDTRRPLTEQGCRVVQRMAQWAAESGIAVQQIRHSGILRAEQTADIFAQCLKDSFKPVVMSGLKPNDDVRPVAAELEEIQHSLMLVGHLPFLGRLTSLLIYGHPDRPSTQFQPATLVGLECREQVWSIHCEMSAAGLP